MEEPVVTNDLDKAQSRQVALELLAPISRRPVARPLLTPSVRDYGFQPRDPPETARQAALQLLNTYAIGPAARTPRELAQRTALRARFLTPQIPSLSEYRERLRVQGQRGSVPPMRTYPVVFQPGEDSTEYDSRFELWVEKSRRLSSMEALRATFSEVDARLERRLRFDYAKLRGVAVIRGQTRSVGADPAAAQLKAGKNEATDDAVASPRGAVDLSDQTRPRHQGNPAGGAPQTPMRFRVGSPTPRPGAVAELSQSLGQLRLLVQHVDQRVYRCCDDIDSQNQRLDWVQVPRELWDHLRGLDDRVAALERWMPYWQDSVRRDEETQRTLAVLRGQIDLLARLRETPPGHDPVTAPRGAARCELGSTSKCVGDALDPRSPKLPGPGQNTA
ncbi:unnamed protein product [Phytophthora fragariaefolia]|uniref:Unnamed protein product n=1 Tax=Phytophthora fragariaefolia TaxID=1490495 RepID=A0A9W6XVB3_9STRA|nr:unnamed protein product [Phytophthora fragariaefolia]